MSNKAPISQLQNTPSSSCISHKEGKTKAPRNHMTIVIHFNKALFPQKEIKLCISYSKFKAKTSIIQISSWAILQKVIQLTHLKTASQNRHRRHQIHYRTLNMENHPNFLSLLKDTSQLKGSGLNFVTGCKLLLDSNRSLPTSKSKR